MPPPPIAAAPRRVALVALLVSLSLLAAPAAAAPPTAAASPSDAEVARRLAFIEARLGSGTAAANRWWDAWFYGWTAFTMVQATVALATTDRGLRIDMAVGAASSSLGVLPLGVFPLPARSAARKLGALPGATPEERRRKLGRAEQLLNESADAEALGRSWITHALGGAVSLGFGLLLGFGYKRPVSGVINTVGGVALTELQIFTQPTRAIDDLRAYQELTGSSAAKLRVPAGKVGWTLIPQAGGLGIAGWF